MLYVYHQVLVPQGVQCLPSMHENLHLSHSTKLHEYGGSHLSSPYLGDKTQDHPWLCTKFGVWPVYMRYTQKEKSRYIWFYWWIMQNSLMGNRKWENAPTVLNDFTRPSLLSYLNQWESKWMGNYRVTFFMHTNEL